MNKRLITRSIWGRVNNRLRDSGAFELSCAARASNPLLARIAHCIYSYHMMYSYLVLRCDEENAQRPVEALEDGALDVGERHRLRERLGPVSRRMCR